MRPAGAGGRGRTEEVCRRHGISTATFYKLKGGDEKRWLKKLLTEAVFDVAALKDLLKGKN